MSTKLPKKNPARRRTPKVTRTDSRTAARAGVKRSKPKTAYDLCELVAQHIEEEPRRYHQGLWGFERDVISYLPHQPPCGTVCCRAGWIVALHDGGAKPPSRVASRSNVILGYDPRDDDATWSLYYDDSLHGLEQGTAEYARIGAAGLRAWMEERKAHLKARLLKDVPTVSA